MKNDKPTMVIAALRLFLFAITFAIALTGCSGGSGGGSTGGGSNAFSLNGGPVSGSISPTSASAIYAFNVVADTVYNVSMVTTSGSGDYILQVYNGAPVNNSMIGYSWNSLTNTPLNNVSFIASITGTVYVRVSPTGFNASTYTLEASTGGLAIGTAKAASTYNQGLYYSFEAVANTAYQVQLTPQTGNVDISSVYAKQTASVGSSLLPGTSMDTVTFLAPATLRYYVRVASNSVASSFNIQVNTASIAPDLRVVVNSATSDTTKVTVNYTVYNQGLTAAGPFDVALWSNATSAPTLGTTGQATASVASLAAGATTSGTVVITNTGSSGTAYAIVDNTNTVIEANETNNVSPGVAWIKPLAAPQSFNFENNVVPAGMTMSGNANWVADASTGGSASTHSLKSGAINSGQTSCVAFSAANAASISFDYSVSSQQNYDYLYFYIDGVQQWSYAWSGTVPWANTGAIAVNNGVHEYKWCYARVSYSSGAGSNTAWIDNIVVVQSTVDLQVAINSVVSNGNNVTVNYTASNAGTSASSAFNVDIWSNSAVAPSLGATGQNTIPYSYLAAGGTVTGSVTIANAGATGTAYAIVDTANAVAESNETNNVSAGVPWTSSVDLQVAVTSAASNSTSVTVNYTVTNIGTGTVGPFNVDIWSNSAGVPLVGATGEATVAAQPYTTLAAGASVSGSVIIANTGASGTAYAIVDTLNAIGESNENNNVSAGVAWTAPPAVAVPAGGSVTYNFESGVVPPVMVMSGNAAWVDTTNNAQGGANKYDLKAGTITDSQTSCVAVYATASTSISFDYAVSSEQGSDLLNFYIDGVVWNSWSGVVPWATAVSYSNGVKGTHEFKWCYAKNASLAAGWDTAWIDNVVIK